VSTSDKRELIDMARRHLAHVEAGTVDQAADVYRVPAEVYFDEARHRREIEQIFRRLPLVLGFSAELREPGSYRALWAGEVPVLLVRGRDGMLRGFLNVCSHRGAVVVPDGAGQARRFTCPYHAWTYDDRGALVGIYKRDDFGDVDTSCLGLTPIPVAERAGLVLGVLTPGVEFDFDTFLCGYDRVLAHLGLESCHLVGRQSVDGPNWKVAYDGYLDFYHLPILHRESFGAKMPSDALYDAWGPHQRVSMPTPAYRALAGKPESEWDPAGLVAGVWTVFPHVSIADFDAGGKLYMVSQLFPGRTADESVTVQNFLATEAPDEARMEKIAGTMAFLEHVVRDEDYFTGNRIQKAVKTGAKRAFLFGRNEAGGQRFHRWVNALLDTPDDALAKRFAEGVGS
jgi:phenylpropionate dioxygenase-like ring-hydroxylating dioxygenase large terminal subunit